ncbi:MAG TPA: ABC transporter permease [Terriglobia bacterium]|nr:ABC transporter permease [Terriglobia bacterium]
MNTASDAVPGSFGSPLNSNGTTPALARETRPLYWSVRREVWENHSIYVAPLAVASVLLFGFLISTIHLPARMRARLALGAAHQRVAIQMPYDIAAFLILLTAFIVAVFYCLDALHGERRDRSVLFWKSMPVSDLTTVLSKVGIPLVVLPLAVFVITVVTQVIMLLVNTLALVGNRPSLAALWSQLPLFKMDLALLYALVAIALWHAPLYGWLLVVSAGARRATFLWAVLPPLGVAIFEKVAFDTSHFFRMLGWRLVGWFPLAFIPQPKGSVPVDPLTTLSPGKFLATPGLWTGLVVAAVLLVAAARLRRYRGSI